jgi:hypothetical protein
MRIDALELPKEANSNSPPVPGEQPAANFVGNLDPRVTREALQLNLRNFRKHETRLQAILNEVFATTDNEEDFSRMFPKDHLTAELPKATKLVDFKTKISKKYAEDPITRDPTRFNKKLSTAQNNNSTLKRKCEIEVALSKKGRISVAAKYRGSPTTIDLLIVNNKQGKLGKYTIQTIGSAKKIGVILQEKMTYFVDEGFLPIPVRTWTCSCRSL